MRIETIKYKNSIWRIIKISSNLIIGTLLGLLYLLILYLNDYANKRTVVSINIALAIAIGFIIFIWLPNLILYLNYLINTIGKTYTIDLNSKSINWQNRFSEKKLGFNEISQIQQVKHISQKRIIENSKNFWDRLENSIGKNQGKTLWSRLSYTRIIGNQGELIILTSLMTNYKNIPIEKMEIKYVKFPWIKK